MKKFTPSVEQQRIFDFNKKNLLINASAGSGKTTTMIEFISRLVENGQDVKRMLVLTFTKAAASEMKERLILNLMSKSDSINVQNQIDDLFTSDICTIHSFLEKVIKRNLSQFPYFEGFKILDEKQELLLKEQSFAQAEEQMLVQNSQDYFNLFLTLRDKKLIKEIIFKIEDFVNAQPDKNQAISLLSSYNQNFERSKEFLFITLNQKIEELKNQIVYFPKDNVKVNEFLMAIYQQFNFNDVSLREMASLILKVSLPRIPVLAGYDKKEDVKAIKNQAQQIIKFAEKLQPENDLIWQTEQSQNLIKEILELYQIYIKVFSENKMQLNYLDFDDLELKSEELLQESEVLNQLQENYDFVFIDEYQDTNPVQEKIVKLMAEKSKFVAIGDPKQGIYAFRNATSQIILKDSKDFSEREDSQTEYLSQNYRSDKDILQFVNHVFSQIMTQKTTGIDYKNTSLLKGDKITEKTSFPAINIIVAQKHKREKLQPIADYNIFDDPLVSDEESDLEGQIVANKIEQLLTSHFVDPETKKMVRVQPKDIAILSRSRNDVCTSVINHLRSKDIPFVSTLRTDLLSKAHIKLILSLLKLCCDIDDDISLASYLLSPFARISMDKLALLQSKQKEGFVKTILNTQDEEIKIALKTLEDFKLQCSFLGARKALEKLFLKTEYFVYLQSKVDENAVKETESLLNIISNYENDKDLAGLCEFLGSDITFSNISGQNAVTISSIHASKGLEYKIVFLIGAGKSLSRLDNASYKISKNLGLGLMVYDEQNWQKNPSLPLLAIREQSRAQERVDEIMILYVALTRAKCHLFITGTTDADKVEDFSQEKFHKFASALDLILSTHPERAGAKVEVIDEVVPLKQKLKSSPVVKVDEKDKQKLEEYLNFKYKYEADTTLKQKASVTELVGHAELENGAGNLQAIEEGNAYHEALKVLDFNSVENIQDVENQLKNQKIKEKYLNIIDFSLIFEIIKLIKPFIKNKKIIKEKQFTMLAKEGQGAKLVQGTIDLYLKGEKNILIDYKYTGQKDIQILKQRYTPQLLLYKQAIENAENIKIDEMYLISLKNKKIIQI